MNRRSFITGLGGAVAWPVVARAQQRALPVIGFLNSGSPEFFTASFRRGLSEQGYVEGRNIEISYWSAPAQYNRLPTLAAELVRHRVAVIFTETELGALAAKAASATIPIVFAIGGDPVQRGLVTSLSRPGGNVTGVSFLATQLVAKRLQLLHETVPAVTRMGYLVNPANATEVETRTQEAENAAPIFGVSLTIVKAGTPGEIEAAFATLVGQRIGALLVDGDPMFGGHAEQLAALATRHAMPAIFSRTFVQAGGLMSYEASIPEAWRLAGTYAGRILKGENPADLPVVQPTKFDLAINLKTAKALGLTIPPNLLAIANEVIE
jgi:putative tryptophan/tyrosine transport system substrate-binding protein